MAEESPFTELDGWPCVCPRKLPVLPERWEELLAQCPHCNQLLVFPDYDEPQALLN